MSRLTPRTRSSLISIFLVSVLVVTVMTSYLLPTHARPVHPGFNHFLSTQYDGDGQYDDNSHSGAAELYSDRAYPQANVSYTQTIGSYQAYLSLSKHGFATAHSASTSSSSWQFIGHRTGNVPGPVTYTGRATVASGRITAIAVSDPCDTNLCRVWVGAAGGGIWRTDHGLANTPDWRSSNTGLASNAIGSIFIDPNDSTGATLYVGTGEPNGSSDSEAGVGLYKSTNYGKIWTLVPGSVSAAKDRSIGSIAVDPTNARHIFIGTDVARHGNASVNGGRFTPPGAPKIGLYESTDSGATFTLVFSKASDTVDPGSPNGNDFFRGGVSKLGYENTTGKWQLYFSVFDYGIYRHLADGTFEQVFASGGAGSTTNSATSRTEFALAPSGKKLRIYAGDADGTVANFYRVDDANVPAAKLTDGTKNPGWLLLSNSTKGTPGYASYNYCDPQCSYDMPIASPAGHPDSVWLGGSMQYGEIFTANPPSNGRAIQRSIDAGVSFTDMTNDTQTPPLGMHPDQHVIVLAPDHPDIAFIGSDGGLVRTSGNFADSSSDCDKRGLSGADLTDCKGWLKAIPTQIFSLNAGLGTIQFQSLTFNPQHPHTDIIGGSQDNGTWAYDANQPADHNWFESVGGDGGQSAIDYVNPNIRMHTYYGPNGDINFKDADPAGWDAITDPLATSKEQASFYVPLIADPQIGGTLFIGLEHVWRTVDDGGPQPYLDQHCNEQTGDFQSPCGDWQPLGSPTATLTDSTYGSDKAGSFVVAIARAPQDYSTLWAATRPGRLFISTNAAAPASAVTFTRIDTSAQLGRFISGIAVDPKNPYHAFVSYSGYNAYTPKTPGHVFDLTLPVIE